MRDFWFRRRPAFTLVELLVVIAIIGILVALLLPAVQAAREAGRRSDCTNKLKQLALAVHNHHDTFKTMPQSRSANANGYDINGRSWSWFVPLLPFFEQQTLYNNLGYTLSPPNTFNQSLALWGTPLTALQCPSDNTWGSGVDSNRANTGGYSCGVTSYKGVSGSNWAWGSYTNTGPSGNNNGLDLGDGLIDRDSGGQANPAKRNFSVVIDGLSNTFMIGEDLPGLNQHCGWPNANYANGTCSIPLNNGLKAGQPGFGNWGDWPNLYSFRSRHPGGGQFAIADGSVQFIGEMINLTVYRQLATRGGSEVVSVIQ